MNIAQPVNSHVNGVSFTFYEPSEVRRMSVKQVVNPVLLDSLGNPTKGGLYDPSMGPFTKHHLCGTCSLSYFNCPGHFGHIELPAPVVNPMMFDTLYRFLQGCCPYCHKFTFNRVTATRYVAKLRLLEYGLVQEANDLDDLLPRTNKTGIDLEDGEDNDISTSEDLAPGSKSKKGGETSEQYIDRINAYVKEKLSASDKSTYKVTMVNQIRRALIKELVGRSRNANCQNCRGPVPKLRRDGFLKIFREPLTRKQQTAQQTKGLTYRDVMSLDVAGIEKEIKSKQKQAQGGTDTEEGDDSDVESEKESDIESGDEEMESGAKNTYDSIDAHPKKTSSQPQRTSVFITPTHLRNHLRLLFSNEPEIVRLLFQQRDPQMATAVEALGGSNPRGLTLTRPGNLRSSIALADMFFIEALPVAPTKFRPASIMGDDVMENPHNVYLGQVLKTCVRLRDLVNHDANGRQTNGRESSDVARAVEEGSLFEHVVNSWVQLQQAVNNVMDSSKNPTLGKNGKSPDPGIRQLLEKKEGLFRQNMMGKRVNFAARSVISPDPNLESDEVGVPPVFAKKLTYPEPVTPHNVKEMRQLVINGPDVWPGAVSVQHEDGSLVYLDRLSHESRVALANQLLTPQESASTVSPLGNMFTTRAFGVNKKVFRHLRNGDMVVMNRQPTLHRASMAGMRAHVLPGERTLRFHYMNCNQFNSDFDGDEMNMHFPQSEAARSELRNIMGADVTYLNPTNGGPLRGLIQDSVDGGVILTKRDTMLTRSEYQELVYWALRPETQSHLPDGKVQLLPPAIFKPKPMWTGKQVVSTLILNLTWGYAPLNMISKNKIGAALWGKFASEEERVLVLDGELLIGVLDKSQFGAAAYGLIHSIYELYTPTHAGRMLSILGRLFLRYLQEIGFSCRMEDLLFDKEGDALRKEINSQQGPQAIQATLDFLGMGDYKPEQLESDPRIRQEFHDRMEEVTRDQYKLAQLDGTVQNAMSLLSSGLTGKCLPKHLHLPFPHNNMSVMTTSGAKGSNVNFSQITCGLGQQSLEGRRVPLMVSGKSLPSFAPFDSTGRAGGYIGSRFLTGLKPQEFYFHCMSGREGLIDTAVKTSRSGYLQRCLIKHLEGIKVHYDYSVRDADGSIIQFQYGEDALDVLKAQHLSKFDFAAANYRALKDKFNPASAAGVLDDELARKYAKKLLGKADEFGLKKVEGEPISSRFNPSRYLGAVSEKFYVDLEKYLDSNPNLLLHEKKSKLEMRKEHAREKAEKKKAAEKKEEKSKAKEANKLKTKMFNSVSDMGALMSTRSSDCSSRNFRMLQYLNYLHSLIEPGESVGLIAAQGIGEPSTQMTLNTFHLAGFGAKNVTLGIPRLREIVMVASDNISAPVMDILMCDGVTRDQAKVISGALTKLTLGDVTDYVEIRESLSAKRDAVNQKRYRKFVVKLQFFPSKEYEEEYDVANEDIQFALEHYFADKLEGLVAKDLKRTYRSTLSDDMAGQDKSGNDLEGEEDEDNDVAERNDAVDDSDADSDMDEDGDGDADDARAASRRKEKTSYDGPDDDDKEIMESMDAELDELNNMASADTTNGKKKKAGGSGDDSDSGDESNSNSGSSDEEMDVDDEHNIGTETSEAIKRVRVLAMSKRRKRMIDRYPHVVDYNFVDEGSNTYAEIELQFPATTPKFLMLNLAEEAVRKTIVREIPGIELCSVNKNKAENDPSVVIGAYGSNIRGIWDASVVPLEEIANTGKRGGISEWVDINRLYTNDIAAILRVYGVEAARQAIVREIYNVFNAYNIEIDNRHLGLVADYMTFEGGFKPFNRIGLSSSPSPFAKMSFESTCTFLQEATVYGDFDDLRNPSARIVMGQPVQSGTGSFDVLADLAVPASA
ncbi:hypothetical protein IW140_002938 [Coemansia sp. RSA 1813]|nr:hypothetical protein LPJ74_001849 [Coemansia sp. RSA 1843]KAJ2089729.1 hypothetical protein IW138_003185 [Coemansia sp. RSA 986]KAJ2214266.1 hypothetical protein EV179_003168 [Coemansia sp. RSA 487]KAJ2569684.1 hypothetical protein IW140_002938 [Coemansia sp. RSA 1813]